MAITIRQVLSKKDLKNFIWFGINLYKNCEYAAIPLFMDDWLNLKRETNPAFETCEAIYFLAYKDDKIVGKIAGIINPSANAKWNQKHVRFGWIDFIDDQEVSTALLKAVEEWGKAKGMNALQGPMGFTDFDHEGALIKGFDQLGTLATIYNYAYYPQHYENYGLTKDVDTLEYLITIPEVFPDRYFKFATLVQEKYNLRSIKSNSRKELVKRYGLKIFKLLNDCYKDLYGFAPLSDKQMNFYIKMYLSFFRLDTISLVVDQEDNAIAIGIAMPSFTKALQQAKGRLLPLGWYHMLNALKKNDLVDLYLMAIHPEYQSKGVNSILFADLMPAFAKNGYKLAESNPELESNTKMSSQWDNFEHINHKQRRIYLKKI